MALLSRYNFREKNEKDKKRPPIQRQQCCYKQYTGYETSEWSSQRFVNIRELRVLCHIRHILPLFPKTMGSHWLTLGNGVSRKINFKRLTLHGELIIEAGVRVSWWMMLLGSYFVYQEDYHSLHLPLKSGSIYTFSMNKYVYK